MNFKTLQKIITLADNLRLDKITHPRYDVLMDLLLNTDDKTTFAGSRYCLRDARLPIIAHKKWKKVTKKLLRLTTIEAMKIRKKADVMIDEIKKA